jgi:hypothetical protein
MSTIAALDRTQQVAVVRGRTYVSTIGQAGSTMTDEDPIKPQAARFIIRGNVWTRFWWYIDQRSSDFERATLWISDETTAPVKVFDGVTMSVGGTPPTISSWWFEQNTSQDRYRGARRDLVSWVRNFVALQDPADVTSLLLPPLAGAPPPPTQEPPTNGPAPPTNLRIITQ